MAARNGKPARSFRTSMWKASRISARTGWVTFYWREVHPDPQRLPRSRWRRGRVAAVRRSRPGGLEPANLVAPRLSPARSIWPSSTCVHTSAAEFFTGSSHHGAASDRLVYGFGLFLPFGKYVALRNEFSGVDAYDLKNHPTLVNYLPGLDFRLPDRQPGCVAAHHRRGGGQRRGPVVGCRRLAGHHQPNVPRADGQRRGRGRINGAWQRASCMAGCALAGHVIEQLHECACHGASRGVGVRVRVCLPSWHIDGTARKAHKTSAVRFPTFSVNERTVR